MNLLKDVPIHDSTLIVTIDVKSLYTKLIQQDVLLTTKKALDSKSDLKREQKGFLIEALAQAMYNNNFWHEGSCFKQVKGVAMGAKYAPSVANISMSQWEEHCIFGVPTPEISLYKRYIDDIIILWNGTVEALETFLSNINNNCYGLKFTGNWDLYEISFLALVLVKANGRIQTKTYFKGTDRNSSIPMASCHHPRWLGGVPKGQLMRIMRNCDNMSDYLHQSEIVVNKFKEKGYQNQDLRSIQSQIMDIDRKLLLEDKPKNKSDLDFIAFLTNFS